MKSRTREFDEAVRCAALAGSTIAETAVSLDATEYRVHASRTRLRKANKLTAMKPGRKHVGGAQRDGGRQITVVIDDAKLAVISQRATARGVSVSEEVRALIDRGMRL